MKGARKLRRLQHEESASARMEPEQTEKAPDYPTRDPDGRTRFSNPRAWNGGGDPTGPLLGPGEKEEQSPWATTGPDSLTWRGDTLGGSFEGHPLHTRVYASSLSLLKWCQEQITGQQSSVNSDGETEFSGALSIERLLDLRKHAMAVSAKLAGELSSENRDTEEIKLSLEFCSYSLESAKVVASLLTLAALDVQRSTHADAAEVRAALATFHEEWQDLVAEIEAHCMRLLGRII